MLTLNEIKGKNPSNISYSASLRFFPSASLRTGSPSGRQNDGCALKMVYTCMKTDLREKTRCRSGVFLFYIPCFQPLLSG
jgi:hypothetical protein